MKDSLNGGTITNLNYTFDDKKRFISNNDKIELSKEFKLKEKKFDKKVI